MSRGKRVIHTRYLGLAKGPVVVYLRRMSDVSSMYGYGCPVTNNRIWIVPSESRHPSLSQNSIAASLLATEYMQTHSLHVVHRLLVCRWPHGVWSMPLGAAVEVCDW